MNTFLGGIFGTPDKTQKLIAKSKKNQVNMNKAVLFGLKYNRINDLRDRADDMGDSKAFKKYDREASLAFDRHLDFMSELPKTEQARVEKFVFTF